MKATAYCCLAFAALVTACASPRPRSAVLPGMHFVRSESPVYLDEPGGIHVGRALPGALVWVAQARDGWYLIESRFTSPEGGLLALWVRADAITAEPVDAASPVAPGGRAVDLTRIDVAVAPGTAAFVRTACAPLHVIADGSESVRVVQRLGRIEIAGWARTTEGWSRCDVRPPDPAPPEVPDGYVRANRALAVDALRRRLTTGEHVWQALGGACFEWQVEPDPTTERAEAPTGQLVYWRELRPTGRAGARSPTRWSRRWRTYRFDGSRFDLGHMYLTSHAERGGPVTAYGAISNCDIGQLRFLVGGDERRWSFVGDAAQADVYRPEHTERWYADLEACVEDQRGLLASGRGHDGCGPSSSPSTP